MQVPIATWEILDWQGPATNVRFRVLADSAFLAKDDDGTHVQVDASPKIFREVDCVVDTVVIGGLTVKRITVPAMWLFSTTDAIVNKQARYSSVFVTKSGSEIMRPELLQSITLPVDLLAVFNPVPIQEVIRVNNPAAPIPTDRETFSKEQILALIGQGPTQIGTNSSSPKFAYWQSPTTIGGVANTFTGANFNALGDPLPIFDFFRNGGFDTIFRIRHEGVTGGNPKVLTFGGALTLHLQDANTQWHLLYANDTATSRWVNNIFDDGRLEFRNYTTADVPQARVTFDKDGGIGVRRTAIAAETAWLFRDTDGFHIGTSTTNDIAAATRQLTFVHGNTGIGINKQTVIEAQLDILSGSTSRVALSARSANGTTADIARFTTFDGSRRFVVKNDGRIELGQSNAIKGSILFHRPNTANDIILSPPNTGDAVEYVFPATAPANGQLLRTLTFSGGVATLEWVNPTAGGDVSSDISSVVDNTLARFQSTSGKLITGSAVIVNDTTGAFDVPNDWDVTNVAGLSVLLGATTLTLQGLTGSSIAIQQTKTLFNAPAAAAATLGFDFVQGSQTQSTGLSRFASFAATYNQTSTAASTSLEITRTETALGSGEHNFIKGFGGAAGTTARFRINQLGNYFFGATGGFIGDQNGNEYLLFTTVTSAVNGVEIINAATGTGPTVAAFGDDATINLTISGKGSGGAVLANNILSIQRTDNAALRISKTAATARLFEILVSGNDSIAFSEAGVGDFFTGVFSTKVITFNQIPVGPNSTPTTDNQLARKKYVDDRIVTFVIPFRVDDPSTFPTSDDGAAILVQVPSIVGAFLSKITIIRPSSGGGSHTSGGTATFIARIFNSSNVGSGIAFSDSNNLANTIYTEDFSDTSIAENNYITFILTRSGTISERNVSINIHGYRKHQN